MVSLFGLVGDDAVLVALEGIDASGKQTQARLLVERARAEGLVAESIAFPRYGATRFGREITSYLKGEHGGIQNASPRLIAMLYAGDRFESLSELRGLLDRADLVVCDRYVGSNLAYQGAKFEAPRRRELFEWIWSMEHEVYRLPYADLNIFLDVPLDTATRLMIERRGAASNGKPADIHEDSLAYLTRCRSTYFEAMRWQGSEKWRSIACVDATGAMLDRARICDTIWGHIREALSARCGATGPLWGHGAVNGEFLDRTSKQ